MAHAGCPVNGACFCVVVRSRSLLFYNEEAPLEESLATSEGERLQSEGHSHNQISRYTADGHSNQTSGSKIERRYKQTPLYAAIFTRHLSNINQPSLPFSSPQRNKTRWRLWVFLTQLSLSSSNFSALNPSKGPQCSRLLKSTSSWTKKRFLLVC